MRFETRRLILRPWKETDAESLYEYAKDERVGPAAGWPPHTDVENSREIIRTVLSAPGTYAVCLRENDIAIGSIGLMIGKQSHLDLPDSEGEIGYWIGVPFWGQGLIPEAVRELMRHAFRDLHLKTLWCGYFDGNHKSRRVQEKCGFIYDRTEKDVLWEVTGQILTEHISKCSREDWKNSFQIRKCGQEEMDTMLALARDVFLKFETPDYAPEGTDTFLTCLQDEQYLGGMEYYGAFDSGTLIGEIGIRPDRQHICFFFVDGRYQRLGVGTGLFRFVRQLYPKGTITLNSAPYGFPFYKAIGFHQTGAEQTVSGIRFTPMAFIESTEEQEKGNMKEYHLITLREQPGLMDGAAEWFHSKWGVPKEAYLECMASYLNGETENGWYLCLDGERIVGGMGVIDNDFHNRKDLSPNVCAVFVEEDHRGKGIAGRLLDLTVEDMRNKGVSPLYLVTDHTGFYERYGWEFFCMVQGDGEPEMSRMYIHR